jgi:hypothetical protein
VGRFDGSDGAVGRVVTPAQPITAEGYLPSLGVAVVVMGTTIRLVPLGGAGGLASSLKQLEPLPVDAVTGKPTAGVGPQHGQKVPIRLGAGDAETFGRLLQSTLVQDYAASPSDRRVIQSPRLHGVLVTQLEEGVQARWAPYGWSHGQRHYAALVTLAVPTDPSAASWPGCWWRCRRKRRCSWW